VISPDPTRLLRQAAVRAEMLLREWQDKAIDVVGHCETSPACFDAASGIGRITRCSVLDWPVGGSVLGGRR
jgi:hypothetical protein